MTAQKTIYADINVKLYSELTSYKHGKKWSKATVIYQNKFMLYNSLYFEIFPSELVKTRLTAKIIMLMTLFYN